MIPWITIAKVAAVLAMCAAVVGGIWYGIHSAHETGRKIERAVWEEKAATDLKNEAKVVAAEAVVTEASDVKAVATETKIVTVFKDRLIYRTQEVPVEVITKMDSECVVPNGFVSLWDSANKATVPDATSKFDATPSGIKLSDVSEQKDVEASICTTNTERLKGLQEWIRNIKTITLK